MKTFGLTFPFLLWPWQIKHLSLSLAFSSCLFQPVLYLRYRNVLFTTNYSNNSNYARYYALFFLPLCFSFLSFPIPAKFLIKETKFLLSYDPFNLSDIQAAEHISGNPCNLTAWCHWKRMACRFSWALLAAQPTFLVKSPLSFSSAAISIANNLLLSHPANAS